MHLPIPRRLRDHEAEDSQARGRGPGIAGPGRLGAGAEEVRPGRTDKEIKLGHINPYSGPASAYGAIGKAIGAYFDKVNAEGGVNGRKIKFISLDDGYNPAKTVEQARKLVEQEEVLFLFQTWARRRTRQSTST